METISNDKFASYLTEDFKDLKHKNQSLIEIFLFDPDYYDSLLDKQSIDAKAAYFISKYSSDIRNTSKSHPELRKLKCQMLIEQFVDNYSTDSISWDLIKQNRTEQMHQPVKEQGENNKKQNEIRKPWEGQSLKCPKHEKNVKLIEVIPVLDKNKNPIDFPIFSCPNCGKKYTFLTSMPFKATVRFEKKDYYNLYNPKKHKSIKTGTKSKTNTEKPNQANSSGQEIKQPSDTMLKDPKKIRCIKYGTAIPRTCRYQGCTGGLGDKRIKIRNTGSNTTTCVVKECKRCGMNYVSYQDYNKYPAAFEMIGSIGTSHNPTQKDPFQIGTYDIKTFNLVKNSTNKYKEADCENFVIRQNTFHSNKHSRNIEEIDAIIEVIGKDGRFMELIIPAGYCSKCKTFFILESTFQKIQRYGIPVCRVLDEESYRQLSQHFRSDQLRNESIIKQYGYSVNQQENLSSFQRLLILTMLIDYNICTKDQIINLLNYHIHMREKQDTDKFNLAISKWEEDRDYIERYRVGEFRKVYVNSISRRR